MFTLIFIQKSPECLKGSNRIHPTGWLLTSEKRNLLAGRPTPISTRTIKKTKRLRPKSQTTKENEKRPLSDLVGLFKSNGNLQLKKDVFLVTLAVKRHKTSCLPAGLQFRCFLRAALRWTNNSSYQLECPFAVLLRIEAQSENATIDDTNYAEVVKSPGIEGRAAENLMTRVPLYWRSARRFLQLDRSRDHCSDSQ